MKLFNHPSLFLALALVTRASSRLDILNDVNLSSVQDDKVGHKDLAPRADRYDRAVEKGQAFLAQLNSYRYSAPTTQGTVADSGLQGWRIEPVSTSAPDQPLRVVLQGLVGPLRNQYYEWSADYKQNKDEASYHNLYGPKDGVIAALVNYNSAASTPLSHWSELSWRMWVAACASASINPKTLKYIIRHDISNIPTLDIIEQIYHEAFPHKALGDQITLLPSGSTSRAFQALLGSPNGWGVAWMLLNKRDVLGKTIAKITVQRVEKTAWDAWFEFEEVAAVASSSVGTE